VKSEKNHLMFGQNHLANTLLIRSIAKGTPIFVYNSNNTTLMYTFISSKKANEFLIIGITQLKVILSVENYLRLKGSYLQP